jgi:hypothetical protein
MILPGGHLDADTDDFRASGGAARERFVRHPAL